MITLSNNRLRNNNTTVTDNKSKVDEDYNLHDKIRTRHPYNNRDLIPNSTRVIITQIIIIVPRRWLP